MRPDRNGIVRTEWPTGSQADGANKSPEAVDGRAHTAERQNGARIRLPL
jgi:hypothetical protein